MEYKIALLPGDGIGKEVMKEAVKVLSAIEKSSDVNFYFKEFLVGGAAIDEFGKPLRNEDLDEIKTFDAVLLGAVGGPKWDNVSYEIRPESALLALRKELGLFANIRPVKVYDEFIDSSPLKNNIVRGCDLVVVRELTGGLYYGEPRALYENEAYNTLRYSREEVERIARVAFDLARDRKKKVTSVDKANVLETFKFWRKIVEEVAKDYPDVELGHMYVDNASMQLIRRPSTFDVLLCPNLFGDILSDEAAMMGGSIGILPSASIGFEGRGMFEPVHGSAPDIAGRNIANPVAMILSVSLMLEVSFNLKNEAKALEKAVVETFKQGYRTPDMAEESTQREKVLHTDQMGDLIVENLNNLLSL